MKRDLAEIDALAVCRWITDAYQALAIQALVRKIEDAPNGAVLLQDALGACRAALRERGNEFDLRLIEGHPHAKELAAMTHIDRDLVELVFKPSRASIVIEVLKGFIAAHRIGATGGKR